MNPTKAVGRHYITCPLPPRCLDHRPGTSGTRELWKRFMESKSGKPVPWATTVHRLLLQRVLQNARLEAGRNPRAVVADTESHTADDFIDIDPAIPTEGPFTSFFDMDLIFKDLPWCSTFLYRGSDLPLPGYHHREVFSAYGHRLNCRHCYTFAPLADPAKRKRIGTSATDASYICHYSGSGLHLRKQVPAIAAASDSGARPGLAYGVTDAVAPTTTTAAAAQRFTLPASDMFPRGGQEISRVPQGGTNRGHNRWPCSTAGSTGGA
ncbi:hypothetical protein ZHAS_00003837 [Anopheles sinensis]|uniref:Uncharacterized protein n=1 Tax=Anopheles sinensis TaxID=74873 RepID=A0A084VFD2_ANOSI|nr:hypothetical protein ZHAS_00003837 [Anopheles sinensis]